MNVKYLGVNIRSNGKLRKEVKAQTDRAAMRSGYVSDIVWRNKNQITMAAIANLSLAILL